MRPRRAEPSRLMNPEVLIFVPRVSTAIKLPATKGTLIYFLAYYVSRPREFAQASPHGHRRCGSNLLDNCMVDILK